MRPTVLILAVLLVGCSSQPSTTATNLKPDLKPTYGVDFDKEYAQHILGSLDHFALVAKEAETVDESSWTTYRKEGKFSKTLLQRLNQGLALETEWLKKMSDMHPPEQFQTFHQQVLRNTQAKVDNLAALILAMEKNDKNEIAKVLDKIDLDGKLGKIEMEKIIQGKTAETYLGLK